MKKQFYIGPTLGYSIIQCRIQQRIQYGGVPTLSRYIPSHNQYSFEDLKEMFAEELEQEVYQHYERNQISHLDFHAIFLERKYVKKTSYWTEQEYINNMPIWSFNREIEGVTKLT